MMITWMRVAWGHLNKWTTFTEFLANTATNVNFNKDLHGEHVNLKSTASCNQCFETLNANLFTYMLASIPHAKKSRSEVIEITIFLLYFRTIGNACQLTNYNKSKDTIYKESKGSS